MTKPHAGLLRLLIKHNPFYLLSAACMLAGILFVTNSLSWTSIALPRLLLLILTLNIYEAALIALALYLIVKRHQFRDGKMLLILEAFFLVDTSFLNAEIVTAHYTLGLALNITLFALAAIKIGVVLHVLKPDFSPAQFLFVLTQIAALFAVPCLYRHLDHGAIAPVWFYAGWWLLGLLPAAYELLVKTPLHRDRIIHFATNTTLAAPTTLYLLLPWLSLMLHISILHYVYDVTFFGACAAPPLLALTLAMNRAQPSRLIPRRDMTVLQMLLPLAAVLVSLNNPHVLFFQLGHSPYLTFTPLSLAIAGAYLTYIYCFLWTHALLFLSTGLVAILLTWFGPSPSTLNKGIAMICRSILAALDYLTPKTLTQWGVLSLISSFFFLAIGAVISLHRPNLPEPDTGLDDSPT